MLKKINHTLFKPVNIAPLIIFRIFFGFLVACEGFGAIFTGWVKTNLIDPQFTFTFIGFEWLNVLLGPGMYGYFITLGTLGLFIMLGLKYRVSIILYTILWSGAYFIQKTSYNNHYYLLMLVSMLMIFLPANRKHALDIKWFKTKESESMGNWIRILFIAQMAIVYIFAALAKFYPDWLDGTFTRNLYHNRSPIEWICELFNQKWFYLSIAYLGILYDLLIVPFLLYSRTRTIALICSLIFHLTNSITLQIGIFPYFALSTVVFFYNSDQVSKFFFKRKNSNNYPREDLKKHHTFLNKNLIYGLILPYLIIQLILPIRHHFIKSDVLWTEEGHRLSWRMMLRKRSGHISIKIVDNKTKIVSYRSFDDLTNRQYKQLATKPDFIWQYCQRIKKEYQSKDISIYVYCRNAINNKQFRTLIDPNADFAKAKWHHLTHNPWILP